MNLFNLAEKQLQREGRELFYQDVLDRAVYIRKWLDDHSEAVADRILEGEVVYRYNGNIKTYKKGA
jgi:hypothetical protein